MKKRALIFFLVLCLFLTGMSDLRYPSHTKPISDAAVQTLASGNKKVDKFSEEQHEPDNTDIQQALAHLSQIETTRPVDEAFLTWAGETIAPDFTQRLTEALRTGDWQGEPFYHLFGETLHVLWDRYTGAPELSPHIHETDAPGPVTLAFTGDVNLSDSWENMLAYRELYGSVEDVISPALLQRMRDADILLVNNEFCFSDRGNALPGKLYTFRAATENVQILQEMGVDIVSLANNHVYDYGADAFLDTLNTLQQADIPYVGAGQDLNEAMQAQYFHAGGMKIAYVAASMAENYVLTPGATHDTPGILWCYEDGDLLAAVSIARQNADWVIVYPHWGTEYETAADRDQVMLAQKLADAGADFVIGAHPHVLQGVEYYGDRAVVYSLGNFWFNTGWMYTALLEVELLAPGEYRLRIQPCLQAAGTVRLLEDDAERRALFRHLESISHGIEIDSDGLVHPV